MTDDKRSEREIIAEAYSDEARATWKAPVQIARGGRMHIPWDIHLEAYEAYCKKWSHQTALIDLKGRGCRGGFGTEELDGFVPGWRDRVTAIGKMATRLAELEAAASAPPTGIAALPQASITKLITAFSKIADFTTDDDMAIHEALLDAMRIAKGRTVSSAKLIAMLDDPAIAGAVNEHGSGRHA